MFIFLDVLKILLVIIFNASQNTPHVRVEVGS